METIKKNFNNNSIVIELPEVKRGETATISYKGTLTDNGAPNVYLHYGFDGWHQTRTVPMEKQRNRTCTTDIEVDGNKEINICFRDDEFNWDNNCGINYKVEIK
jgi:Starch/carbohydrate-binding module (family 53)